MKKRLASSLSKGFTLIELLVVISVTGILSAIGIASFVSYSRQQQVTQAVNDLKNNLRIAQGKALTQEIPDGCSNFSAYELKFKDEKSYTVYPICSNEAGQPIISVSFPSQVAKVAGGPSTIRFKILTGAVDGSGTIAISGFNLTQSITVTAVGGIK